MFGNEHMLHYLCCFCPDSSFSLSHFLGEPSSIFDKTNPDWAPNQNLGYDFRGVSAKIVTSCCALVNLCDSVVPVGFQRRFSCNPVGFQRRVKNDTKEPRREVKSEEGVNVPVPYLNWLISQRMICWLRLTLHPVLRKTKWRTVKVKLQMTK